jgi:hypothetical protein
MLQPQDQKGSEVVPVDVVRFDVTKSKIARALIPLGLVLGISARRLDTGWGMLAATALALGALVLFALGRRRFGHRSLSTAGTELHLDGGAPPICRGDVSAWTLAGRTARLYGPRVSWQVRTDPSHAAALRAALSSALGKPLVLRKRGSAGARLGALLIALGGLGLTAATFLTGSLPRPIVTVAALATLGGLAFLGALSQSIAVPDDRR